VKEEKSSPRLAFRLHTPPKFLQGRLFAGEDARPCLRIFRYLEDDFHRLNLFLHLANLLKALLGELVGCAPCGVFAPL
jgi:hypothetical protein